MCLIAIELARAHHDFVSFGHVHYRTPGDDFLTYESQAHAVLRGSMSGEETVFVYAPAFRYVLALGHLVLGNGDARLTLVMLASLAASVFAFGFMCLADPGAQPLGVLVRDPRRRDRGWMRLGAMAAIGATVVLTANPTVVGMFRASHSEYPTWALVTVALALSQYVRTVRAALIATALAALAMATRFDQSIGLLFLLTSGAVALWEHSRGRIPALARRARLALVIFGVIVLLPAAHNLRYGNKLQILPTVVTGNVPLPPSRVIRVLSDPSSRAVFSAQLRGVTVVGASAPHAFVLTVRLLQAAWFASLVSLAANWRRASYTTRLVAILPLAFLLPHLFLQVYVYYPRHVVAGYLVMGLAAAFVMGRLSESPRDTLPPSIG